MYDRPDMLAHGPTAVNGRSLALREALGVFAAVSVATWVLSRLEWLPILRTHLHLVVGVLFLVVALRCSERLPGGPARYGIALGGLLGDDEPEPGSRGAADVGGASLFEARDRGFPATRRAGSAAAAEVKPAAEDKEKSSVVELLRTLWRGVPSFLAELGVAALVCALVFPPFVMAFYLWHAPVRPFAWLPDHDLGAYALTQVLVVGLPEEALFRGYLQGRLHDAYADRGRVLRVELSVRAWLLQALLFALLHFIVDYQPARLAVFFPALLFGWLAALRRGIGAAILVHAACNLLSDLLVRGWL